MIKPKIVLYIQDTEPWLVSCRTKIGETCTLGSGMLQLTRECGKNGRCTRKPWCRGGFPQDRERMGCCYCDL